MEKKVTKEMVLMAIKVAAENGANFGETVTAEDVVAYANKTIEQLHNKAVKAKEYGAKKRAEGDALYEAVVNAVDVDAKTIDEITADVEGEDVTRAKVIARLTKMVKEGKAYKAQVKVDGKKVTVYATEPIDAEAPEEDAE